MQQNLQGLVFALISMAGLGISTFLYKKSTLTLGAVNTTFFYYLFSVVIAGTVWGVFREEVEITPSNLIWPALISIFLFTSVLSFNYAVKHIAVSVGSTIRSLSFIVTVVLAMGFYREQLHAKDIIALGFAISAIVLMGMDVRR